MSYITLDEPHYTIAELDRLEMVVQRRIFDDGYNARLAKLLLKDCPPFSHKKWQRWWRAGWRMRRRDEKVQR
jgi:ribosome modulation factor